MTDADVLAPHPSSTDAAAALRRRRYAADRRLRLYGIAAISTALGLLAILVITLVAGGYPAFTQTFVRVDFPISEDLVDPADPAAGNFRKVMQDGVSALLPGAKTPAQLRAVTAILTANTQFFLRDAVLRDPGVIGGTLTMQVPVSDPYDQLHKGLIDRTTPEDRRRLNDAEIAAFDELAAQGRVSRP
jgi:phosphate transport system permease protein